MTCSEIGIVMSHESFAAILEIHVVDIKMVAYVRYACVNDNNKIRQRMHKQLAHNYLIIIGHSH